MKITLDKDLFLERLTNASKFTSQKLSSEGFLQGVLVEISGEIMGLYSTNLNSYYHTTLKVKTSGEGRLVIDPRKTIEFLSLLPVGDIELQAEETKLVIKQGSKSGTFSLQKEGDFPKPPTLKEKEVGIPTTLLLDTIGKIFFAASNDEARPVLTGINFIAQDGQMVVVSTDGFRLSLLKLSKSVKIPQMLIPRDFLEEISRHIKNEKEVKMVFSENEKIVRITTSKEEFYTRLIEGEFPPFEKVIPTEHKTRIILDRAELLRNARLMAVFAREFSNILIFEVKKDTLIIKPKTDEGVDNKTEQEGEVKGEEQSVAFNSKFLLDVLNNSSKKKIIIEILRPDAPVVFKEEGVEDFIHIIMPVRIQT